MSNEINNINYPLPSNAYAAFDAISLRNLIIERLNTQGVFTDQNYIGSNLASIIDIISFSFNTLIFYLNRTSSESMFTEAQLYENINRIVKLLDYKPVGHQTSTLTFQLSANNKSRLFDFTGQYYTIPRYSYITVAGVPFSFNEDISFSVPAQQTTTVELEDISNKKLLYQGIFKESPVFMATGDSNEIVTLNVSNIAVDHFNIHVYVYEKQENKWFQYKDIQSLQLESSSSRVYEKRLNSNYQYEFTFGDGIRGRKLTKDEKVIIFYLQSSGSNGTIGPNSLSVLPVSKSIFSTSNYNLLLPDVRQDQNSTFLTTSMFNLLMFDNIAGSTESIDVESVEDIRKRAPSFFRGQYRLVTQKDYESWINSTFTNFIADVKVFNNWEYTSKYLKYFKELNLDPILFQQIALNQLLYADACNFNNIYICAVPRIGKGLTLKYLLPAQKENILNNVQDLKTITTEISFLDPIYKGIFFGIEDDSGKFLTDDREFCKLQIVKSSKTNKTNQSLILETASIFQSFFDPSLRKLGEMFDHASLTSKILSVEGIDSINTIRVDSSQKFSGLSVCIWNPTYPELDKKLIARNVNINPFDFLYFEKLLDVSKYITVLEPSYIESN